MNSPLPHNNSKSVPEDSDPWLMLTPRGVLHAFAEREPDDTSAMLQTLLPRGKSLRRSKWLALAPEHKVLLARALYEGWIHEVEREMHAPDSNLDHYLPHAIAGLSGSRQAAIASDDGFCLARVGYSQDEAETYCAAAAEFLDFMIKQRQRGFKGTGRAISFHESIDMLMPSTTFTLFWVDAVGYWLILGGEPLLNNRALVELVWGLRVAGTKFSTR